MVEKIPISIHEFIQSRYPQQQIAVADDIFALGFINSLFALELVMFIEKRFQITIQNEELRLDNFRSVEAMAGLVVRQLTAAS